ncbi:Uncharacterised protein [Burkholderia pseudomallei]|nr:Uncharacterised protein [Burkholderia pseudomallei]
MAHRGGRRAGQSQAAGAGGRPHPAAQREPRGAVRRGARARARKRRARRASPRDRRRSSRRRAVRPPRRRRGRHRPGDARRRGARRNPLHVGHDGAPEGLHAQPSHGRARRRDERARAVDDRARAHVDGDAGLARVAAQQLVRRHALCRRHRRADARISAVALFADGRGRAGHAVLRRAGVLHVAARYDRRFRVVRSDERAGLAVRRRADRRDARAPADARVSKRSVLSGVRHDRDGARRHRAPSVRAGDEAGLDRVPGHAGRRRARRDRRGRARAAG